MWVLNPSCHILYIYADAKGRKKTEHDPSPLLVSPSLPPLINTNNPPGTNISLKRLFLYGSACPGSLSPGLLANACTITYLTRWKERGTIRFIPELVHNLASALALRAPLVGTNIWYSTPTNERVTCALTWRDQPIAAEYHTFYFFIFIVKYCVLSLAPHWILHVNKIRHDKSDILSFHLIL